MSEPIEDDDGLTVDEAWMMNMIAGLVAQGCKERNGVVESGFIRVYADAMRTLAHFGAMEIKEDDGGRYVEATWTAPDKRRIFGDYVPGDRVKR